MSNANRIKVSQEIVANFPHLVFEDTLRTPCISAILSYFGISQKQFRFAQFLPDMVRIFRRHGWKMSPVKIDLKNSNWAFMADLLAKGLYVMSIDSHVFLVSVNAKHEMNVEADTDAFRKYQFMELDGLYKITRIKK